MLVTERAGAAIPASRPIHIVDLSYSSRLLGRFVVTKTDKSRKTQREPAALSQMMRDQMGRADGELRPQPEQPLPRAEDRRRLLLRRD